MFVCPSVCRFTFICLSVCRSNLKTKNYNKTCLRYGLIVAPRLWLHRAVYSSADGRIVCRDGANILTS